MTFNECVLECAGNDEFVREFNRLTGCKLGHSMQRTPFEMAIDKACGYSGETTDDMGTFVAFVYDAVWCRLAPDTTATEDENT